MEGAGFWQQLKVLLWRNILLKKRNRGQLIQEILGPIYFVAILAMIKVLTKPARKPPMMFPPHDINSPAFGSPFVGNSTIFVSPDTAKVDGWMQDIIGQLSGGSPAYRLFATAEEAENEYRANSSGVGAGINFLVDGNQNSYNIRMGFGSLPSTTKLFDSNKGACRSNVNGTGYPGTCEVNKYLFTGFAQLQLAIENMLLREAGVTSPDPRLREVQVQMMDKDEFYPDTSYIQTISSIYFVFSFAFLANFLAVNLVAEKEKKIREGMLMMGLRSSVLWLSWALIYLALVMCVSLVLVAIIGGSEFFQHSNLFLVYISFVLYGGSIMAFAFMLTPLFNKAKVAGAITGFSTVIISLLYLIVSQTRSENSYNANIPPVAQWFMCLLSPIAFAATMDQGIFLDVQRDGFDFDESLTYGDFPLYAPILMMLIDIILYALLTIYLDHVVPGEYGTRYPPHYFLMPSYWCPSRDQGEKTRLIDMRQRTQSHAVDIEPVSQEMEENMAMRITSLTKAYKVEDKMNNVVDEFSLDIYKSQITCLLGHNGAGKTTLMNMLTGVVPPTSGVAQVMGLEITNSQQMEEIRKMCGICPQHNILYDALSCREHLELFASIKGVPDHQIKTAVEKAIRDVDLENQLETFSKDLSGGQKRKLSVAIALIGDPKLIFLDEPTAGMDPYSRRHLWSLLKEKKEGRVVLLTTHFMDEADILADRKAFIRKGKLRCCGSSLFLKNKFGIGYHLTMVVEPDSDTERIRECLHSEIPDIEQQRSHGKELAYTVPMQEVSKFGVLFGKLDEQSESLGIKSYGVSMTTLEEVFLKLEEDHVIDADSEEVGRRNAGFEANNEDVTLMMDGDLGKNVFTKSVISGRALWKQRFQALVKIRFLLMLRNSKALFWQLIFPIGLVTGGLVLAKSNSYQTPETPTTLLLQPSLYANVSGNGNLPDFLVFDSFSSAASQAVVDNFKQRVSVDAYKTGSVNTSDVAPHQIGLQMSRLSGQSLMNFAVLYNDSALHSIPTVISMASQSLLNMSGSSDLINGSSLPWPQLKVTVVYNGNTMGTTLMIGLAFLLVISGFASEAVQDRELKLRSQLRISGIDFGLYWGTMYLVDLISYLIPSLSIIIITLAMQVDGLSSPGAMGAAVLLFLTNIPFNIVLGLVISFIFDKTETCIAYLPHMISTPSMIPFVVVLMVDLVGQSADTAITLHYIFCVVDPLYTLYGGFYFIQRLYLLAQITGQPVEDSEYFKFDNHIMICVLMPVIHAMWMYWLLRILDIKKTGGRVLEAFPCLSKSKSFVQSNNTDVINNEDNDVKAERVRVEAMNTSEDRSQSPAFRLNGMSPKEPVAFMSQLRKVFEKRTKSKGMCNPAPVKSKVAVRNLSVAVDEGEVLGLLGPNGAGKSTALNMMIAETGPTCGKVVIGGHNIRSNMLSLLESLGYCPQHDALWELITLEEHIKCFAAIKGVAPQHLDSVTDFYISSLKLEEHRKKKAKKLSGGTKRKLSYIMSILGSPRLVLMDEPSTGMDPQSKRFLWDTISSSFQNTNKGAILTTHYMEEADALCSRVGIMVNGQLQCLGSTQHLKDTYGSGYILEVKLTGHEAGNVERLMDQLEAHLKTLFPGLDMVERFMERAQYSVPRDDVKSLGVTFSNLEECKLTHNLEEYSFSQSTLEQVFLYFAKQQLEEGKEEMVNTRESALPTSLRRRKTNGAVDV